MYVCMYVCNSGSLKSSLNKLIINPSVQKCYDIRCSLQVATNMFTAVDSVVKHEAFTLNFVTACTRKPIRIKASHVLLFVGLPYNLNKFNEIMYHYRHRAVNCVCVCVCACMHTHTHARALNWALHHEDVKGVWRCIPSTLLPAPTNTHTLVYEYDRYSYHIRPAVQVINLHRVKETCVLLVNCMYISLWTRSIQFLLMYYLLSSRLTLYHQSLYLQEWCM
jgi:hypothetical protein